MNKSLLVTYAYHKKDGGVSFHYSITRDIEAFIDKLNGYKDGPYIVVNVLEISEDAAKRWDGNLRSM
jgi:hypothetical protein